MEDDKSLVESFADRMIHNIINPEDNGGFLKSLLKRQVIPDIKNGAERALLSGVHYIFHKDMPVNTPMIGGNAYSKNYQYNSIYHQSYKPQQSMFSIGRNLPFYDIETSIIHIPGNDGDAAEKAQDIYMKITSQIAQYGMCFASDACKFSGVDQSRIGRHLFEFGWNSVDGFQPPVLSYNEYIIQLPRPVKLRS